jgi:putative peptidoglycan lipid II flippase
MGADRESVRNVLTQSGPLLAGAFLMASIPVVSQSLAATLPAGSVSALAYANRLIGGITALGATALSTATLPYFSRMAVEKDWAACRHTLKRYSTLLLVTTVPFTLFVMALSRYLIKLLYQRGAFTAADTDLVARLQIFLAVQIPFVLLTALFVRFISAIRRNHLLTYVSAINLTVNIVLSLTLMRIWGVAGIAVSISIMYIVSFLFLAGCTILLLARKRLSVLSPVPVHDAHN